MRHIMLDLETLSSSSKAAVIQIGAVDFNLDYIGTGFGATVDVADAMLFGEVSPSTLKWWMGQSDDARSSVMGGTEKLHSALSGLNSFMDAFSGEVYFWAHATFDFPVIMHAFDACMIKPSMHYKKMRDLRTLEMFWGDKIAWEPRTGVHHNALDDAKFQAYHAQRMLRAAQKTLTEGEKS